jgi:hypothetical protein
MVVLALALLLAPAPLPETAALVFHDGREMRGAWVGVRDGMIILEGASDPIPIYEVGSLDPRAPEGAAPPEAKPRPLDDGPALFFREGEAFAGRVVAATGSQVTVQLGAGAPPAAGAPADASAVTIRIPTEALAAFRLREAHRADDLFEADLKEARRDAAARKADVVYVRRGNNLLRVEGVLQGLDDEFLTLEFEGQAKRLRRQLILGVILAPVATRTAESDVPAVFELLGGGQVAGFLAGLRGEAGAREILVRFRGSPPADAQPVPERLVRGIRFSSDRVVFLSALPPSRVEEVPLIGAVTPFPWKKDLAVTGGPIKLAGKTYRKGLGVHARSVLEYDIGARFRSFAATIGLDETAGTGAGVTYRVLADGKELFRKDVRQGARPEAVLLPLEGVKTLRLEVDYGEDAVDFGDHADWAEARLTK